MTKIKLSDLQLILLTTAAAREDRSLLPVVDSVASDAARVRRAIGSLIKRSLVEERPTTEVGAVFRQDEERRIGAFISDAGVAALYGREKATSDDQNIAEGTIPEMAPGASTGSKGRQNTKQSLVISLLQGDGGATLNKLVEATGWLPHTTRAALTGLRKKGNAIARTKVEGVTRYSLPSA